MVRDMIALDVGVCSLPSASAVVRQRKCFFIVSSISVGSSQTEPIPCLVTVARQGLPFRCIMASRTVSKKVMESIADRLACGESLTVICKDSDMPSYRSVTRAVLKNEELFEIYRKGRVMQAEYYSDHINDLARQPLPESMDAKVLNAEVQRRRLEVDTLKFTMAKLQPWGLRDKKEDAPAQQSITISWENGEIQAEG